MKRLGPRLIPTVLTVSLTLGAAVSPQYALAEAPRCESVLSRKYPFVFTWPAEYVRKLYSRLTQKPTRLIAPEAKYNFLSDHDFLQEKKNREKLGIVRSVFSQKHDTRIYFTATGAPDAEGNIPVVDPKAKGLYIYLHGSGTQKASGVNFSYKMNKMATFGYSVLGIDLPFHSDGTRSKDALKAKEFYTMLNNLINEYRVDGMPVYLVGHSFGPDIAAEFVQRHPFTVNGIAMISPAGFTKVLSDWYDKHTSKMAEFWSNSPSNDDGAAWAGVMSSQNTWSKDRTDANPDPTLVNSKLKIRVLSGDLEEYVPGELDARGLPTKKKRDYDLCLAIAGIFARAICRIEANVGHYIFEHKDQNGHDVILREMLALNDQSLANEKALKEDAKLAAGTEATELARRYVREGSFRTYVDQSLGGYKALYEILKSDDVKLARKITSDFNRYVLAQRDRAIVENILHTKEWNTKFYEENKADIDAIDPKKMVASDKLLTRYTQLLENMTVLERDMFATSTADVLIVPQRPAPPAEGTHHLQAPKKNPKDAAPAA